MKAIILAAGYGSRMYPLAQDMPKCLLTIKGETLLGRQLRILKSCGIKDITVVTGFHREKIVELYGEEVSIRYNPHYEITGNMFSLWTAREILTDDFIVFNADVVFSEGILRDLLSNTDSYCAVVDRKACDEEDQKVIVIDGRIVDVGKQLPIQKAYGELIGVAKILKERTKAFGKAIFECVKRDSSLNWPIVFKQVAKEGHVIKFILTKGPWIEIDTKDNYEKAKELFEKR